MANSGDSPVTLSSNMPNTIPATTQKAMYHPRPARRRATTHQDMPLTKRTGCYHRDYEKSIYREGFSENCKAGVAHKFQPRSALVNFIPTTFKGGGGNGGAACRVRVPTIPGGSCPVQRFRNLSNPSRQMPRLPLPGHSAIIIHFVVCLGVTGSAALRPGLPGPGR